MTDDFDGSAAQRWDAKLSDCPYAPSDPRWKRWQRLYISYVHKDDQSVIMPQLQRMEALKAATPEPTEAQHKAEAVMAQIEDYNKWVEEGQPPEEKLPDWANGWLIEPDGTRRPAAIQFFKSPDHLSGRLSRRNPMHQYLGSFDPPSDEPVDPAIQRIADLMHTTPDQIQAAADAILNAFGTVAQTIVDNVKTLADLFKAAMSEPKKINMGWGCIPDWGFAPLLDVWSKDYEDQRPLIAMHTWLQYDAI